MPRKQPNSGSQISTRGTNGPRVKKLNEALVLDLVRRLGPVARPTIASRLGLEFQTVSNICARLIDRGLLLEDGVVDGPHRQSRAVVVNPLAVYSLGVELNREYANAVLISFDGTVHGRRDVLVGDREPADVLDEAADKLGELTHDSGIDDTRIAGIGLSVPGPIDYRSGTILAPINFNAWHGVGVQAELEHRTGRQIWLENTATSAALGEQWTGVGSDTDDFLYIYLGAGVGVGVIAGGRSLHGAYGNAGEFAHLVVDPLGPECPCGQRGCLVQYATPRSMLHLMQRAWMEEKHRNPRSSAPMPQNVADILRSSAPDWLRNAADIGFGAVGRSVARVVTLFDPAKVVFGGPSVELLGKEFVEHTVRELERLPSFGRPRPQVLLAANAGDAGPVGAASLPLHALYSPEVS